MTVISANNPNSITPLMDHLREAEKEAYLFIQKATAPSEILSNYASPSTSEKPLLSRIYDYYLGSHENIASGIKAKQHSLIADDHNLVDLIANLPFNSALKEEVCEKLDQITLNRVEALEQASDLNAITCISKISLSGFTAALSIGFIARIAQDYVSFCSANVPFRTIQNHLTAQCPSLSNPTYFTTTAMCYALPLVAIYQFIHQMSNDSVIGSLIPHPISEKMTEHHKLSVGILMQISSIKDRILNLIKS
ncbi:MAG: hypothetical protein S4CHLAM7_06440 [Chlamydiae bacterium]|nr:hypothetical protein [Chlamydiota bacterium]